MGKAKEYFTSQTRWKKEKKDRKRESRKKEKKKEKRETQKTHKSVNQPTTQHLLNRQLVFSALQLYSKIYLMNR